MAGPTYQALTFKANGIAQQLITDLSVSVPFDPKSPPNPLPTRISTNALWDTGASKSVISQGLARSLALKATGATNVNHAGGISVSPTYIVHFYLPNQVAIAGVQVTEFPGMSTFGAIIGMDVITCGDFAITNFKGQTCMTFRTPSMAPIDYVSDHNRERFAGTPRNAPCPCGSGEKYKRCHGRMA